MVYIFLIYIIRRCYVLLELKNNSRQIPKTKTICANKKIVEGLTVLQTDLENNEITELENMEISFKFIDENTWDILYTTEPFVVEF